MHHEHSNPLKIMIEKGIRLSIFVFMMIDVMSSFSLDEENEEPDDIKTKLMVLDEKIADNMWFL